MTTKKKTTKKNDPAKKESTENVDSGTAAVAEDEQLAPVESNVPATKEETSMATMGPPPMGFDGFTEDDLVIPRISITQKAGDAMDKGFTLGFLRSNLSDEEYEHIRCTAMLYKKGMVLFAKPYQAGAKPICKSNDALVPSPMIESPIAPVCNKIVRRRLVPVCEKAMWTKSDNGKNIPPECNLCYNTIFRRDDNGMGFFMTFRTSGIKPFKNFLSMQWGKQQQLFGVSVDISAEDAKNEYGTFKVPRISKPEQHTAEEISDLIDVYHGFQAMDLDASFDDDRNQGDDGETGGDTSFDTDALSEDEKF